MTYVPIAKKGKMSVYIAYNTSNQTTDSTSYIDFGLNSGHKTLVNQFSVHINVDDTNNRITLPSGKFYLDARLMVKRASTDTWGAEYIWYTWDGSSRTSIGYEGREVGALAIGDPHKNEHARAYIESDGTVIVGLQFKSIEGNTIEVSDTQYDDNSGQSRLMIWKIA